MDNNKKRKCACFFFGCFSHRKNITAKCIYCKYIDEYNDKAEITANQDEYCNLLDNAPYQIIIHSIDLSKEIINKEMFTQEDNNYGPNKYCSNIYFLKSDLKRSEKELLAMYEKIFESTKD